MLSALDVNAPQNGKADVRGAFLIYEQLLNKIKNGWKSTKENNNENTDYILRR